MMREADCIFRGFTGSFSLEVAPTAAGASIKTRAFKCTGATKKARKTQRSSSRANETRLPLVSLKIQKRDVKFSPGAIRKVNDRGYGLDTSEAG